MPNIKFSCSNPASISLHGSNVPVGDSPNLFSTDMMRSNYASYNQRHGQPLKTEETIISSELADEGDNSRSVEETELNTRMENLCLSVTEHALSSEK